LERSIPMHIWIYFMLSKLFRTLSSLDSNNTQKYVNAFLFYFIIFFLKTILNDPPKQTLLFIAKCRIRNSFLFCKHIYLVHNFQVIALTKREISAFTNQSIIVLCSCRVHVLQSLEQKFKKFQKPQRH
jgi:hypothetical protein